MSTPPSPLPPHSMCHLEMLHQEVFNEMMRKYPTFFISKSLVNNHISVRRQREPESLEREMIGVSRVSSVHNLQLMSHTLPRDYTQHVVTEESTMKKKV